MQRSTFPLLLPGSTGSVEFDGLTSQDTMSVDRSSCDHYPPTCQLPISGHRILSRLRRGASLLYQSQPLSLVINRLEVMCVCVCVCNIYLSDKV